MGSEAAFGFAVVNAGSERAIKSEMARLRPAARLAFSRPGLVTWKDEDVDARYGAGSVIARVRGRSLGRVQDLAAITALAAGRAVHVFARDETEDGPSPEGEARATAIREALAIGRARALARGDEVLDVIVDPSGVVLVGVHVHDERAWSVPGGRPAIDVDPEAPSRAYRKLEEALAWAGLAPEVGSVALELGAAPGGAALALCRRGVSVVAVDPGAMDPRVLARVGPGDARVTHVAKAAAELVKADVPAATSLLLCDANLAPPIALRYVTKALSLAPRAALAILTLKVNDDAALAGIGKALERVRALGFADVRATRLPSNRSEICAVARRTVRG